MTAKPCPICGCDVGTTEGCPCCEQWRNGIGTDGKPRFGGVGVNRNRDHWWQGWLDPWDVDSWLQLLGGLGVAALVAVLIYKLVSA